MADAAAGGGGNANGGGGARRWQGRSGGAGGPSSRPSGAPRQWRQAKVWVRDGEGVKAMDVRAGLSDGLNTEITGEGVTEGLEVVIGEVQPGAAGGPQTSTNPFVPQMPGRRRG
jgi:HlyD family secretion protein